MGTQCPRCCNCCSNCNGFSISAQHLTRKEQAEQEMWVDAENKRMVVKYPIVKDPSDLSNNFHQAVKMAFSLETTCSTSTTSACKSTSTICMREIPQEELAAWTGPLNFPTIKY